MLRGLCLSLLTAGLVASATVVAQDETSEPPAYRVVGYFASYDIYDRGYFVTDVPAKQLTHINYAFANVSEGGEVVLGDPWADTEFPYPGDPEDGALLGNFHQLQVLKAAHPGLQTLISVGGWTWSGRFSDAALTPDSRARFARSAVDFMTRYGFDGVDIDWEYPTGGGLTGNVERPEDPANFVLLLAELRAQLDAQGAQDGRHYLLTIALGAGRSAYQPLDWARLHPLLDWINVMTYDMSGSWSAVTGFNAALYSSSDSPPEGLSTDSTVSGLLALGLPADKIVMGVPFYAPGWSGVPAANHGLHQPFTGPAPGKLEPGSYDYRDLASDDFAGFERFWDERAQAAWLYSAEDKIMISHEDPEALAAKARYVREHGLGGIMFWELSQDDGTLLTTLYDALHAPQ